ncbi:MAG: adenylate/guanylate cyclase domain-containing protein [Pseudomonadota bacterium]
MEQKLERRLAAIVAMDMAGFSRLVRIDEEGTIARQQRLNAEIFEPVVAGNQGRIFKNAGDGLLVEFPSAVSAARACVAIQQSVSDSEQSIDPDKRIAYRIGLHIGDVIVDGDDLFGDGVNIAARLEALAEPSTIVSSADAHRQFNGRLEAEFVSAGSRSLKNIPEPVQILQWPADAALPAPSVAKPTVAVLPFENQSSDPENDFIANGMAEDIITDLSRMPWFSVISRNSTVALKDDGLDLAQLNRDLGVAYVLEGSVRKSGDRIRVTAQFIDAASGTRAWANRYDRVFTDIFDIQDEISNAIVSAIGPEFLSAEARRARTKDPTQLDAWECVMRGRPLVMHLGQAETAEARRFFERAVDLSGGAIGNADLALVHFLQAFYQWAEPGENSAQAMVAAAEAAVRADNQDPIVLAVKGWSLMFVGRWDEAVDLFDRAITLAPSFSTVLGFCGGGYCISGSAQKGLDLVEKAESLSPRDVFLPLWLMGVYFAHFSLKDYESAEKTVRRALALAPENPTYRRQLVATLHLSGRLDERDRAVQAYLDVAPDVRASDARRIPGRDRDQVERFVQVLIDAGLPP